ncbi:GerMN domain-containing protein [Paenibacillus segetis]|uniref:GerMN domain-containing protein n=1 Tax=Paenibacillus segetis TaxID=1325360 RepID=A0ABQ1YGM4_9BACL|nr:GerMN domain-containing protein [Paenibacillus segetis]GGH23988.1 hypothetical protein GCM10008013_23450 [Paenibacillus segetis]
MNKKKWVFGMLILLLVLSTGCGQKPQASSGSNSQNEGTESNSVSDPVTVSPGNTTEGSENNTVETDTKETQETKETIKTYYTDDQMMDLKQVSKEISYSEDTQKYEVALKTLQDSGNADLFALWEKVIFKSVKFADGELTVDITLPDEARLGAGGESLAIDSLKQTMFQFTEVKTIELLVDGAQVDSLMGHVELEHPMTRN